MFRLFNCCFGKRRENRSINDPESIYEEQTLLAKTNTSGNESSCLLQFLIKANSFKEFLFLPPTAIDIAMFYDLIHDLIAESEKDWFGFSKESVIVAGLLATSFLASAAYMHHVLGNSILNKESASPEATTGMSLWQKIKSVTILQRFALVGHTLDHTFELATVLLFGAVFFASQAQVNLDNKIKILIQSLGLGIGFIGTLAESLADLELMSLRNAHEEETPAYPTPSVV